jgi:hypothetical protein
MPAFASFTSASAAAAAAGDIANFVEPHTRSTSPAVRCAATSALCAVLLVPEVQAALAASPGGCFVGSCGSWGQKLPCSFKRSHKIPRRGTWPLAALS